MLFRSILLKLKGHEDALALLGKLKLLVRVSAVSELKIQFALSSRFKDFEDAIQHFAVKAEGGISAIVTRNQAIMPPAKSPFCRPTSISRSANRPSSNSASPPHMNVEPQSPKRANGWSAIRRQIAD